MIVNIVIKMSVIFIQKKLWLLQETFMTNVNPVFEAVLQLKVLVMM